jgi:hypothetical protein
VIRLHDSLVSGNDYKVRLLAVLRLAITELGVALRPQRADDWESVLNETEATPRRKAHLATCGPCRAISLASDTKC